MKTSTARVTLDQAASASAAPPVTAASFSTALHAMGFATLVTAIAAWAIVFVVTGLAGSDGGPLRAVPRVAWVLALMFPVLAGLAWREVSRATRNPQGIRISPDGISVTHKHRGVQLRWNQLKSVRAGTIHKAGGSQHRMVPCVTIMAADGTAFNVPALELGSDPNVVAAFLVHHRDRL